MFRRLYISQICYSDYAMKNSGKVKQYLFFLTLHFIKWWIKKETFCTVSRIINCKKNHED
jgi:hypothetical protein